MPQTSFTMMKKLFHAVLVLPLVLLAVSCSESNDNGGSDESVKLSPETKQEQQVFADDTAAPAPIKFTAAAPWMVTVVDTTPVQTKTEGGSEVDWLELSAYEGEKGDVELKMTLSPNYTGADRKAEIRIVCGGTTLTISVEQKATKADGTLPDEATPDDPQQPENPDQPEQPDLKNRIVRIDRTADGVLQNRCEFAYDETGRVTEIRYSECEKSETFNYFITTKITHGEKTVTYESSYTADYAQFVYKPTGSITLDKNGRAISGQYTEFDEKDEQPWSATYDLSYNEAGYLIKTVCKETYGSDEQTIDSETVWTDGNPTLTNWSDGTSERWVDKATYSTVANSTNIDLNWFCMLNTDGWNYTAGDPKKFFAILGYTGERSQYLAQKVTTGSIKETGVSAEYTFTCRTDAEGRITEIAETYRYDDGNVSDNAEYTIHYAE